MAKTRCAASSIGSWTMLDDSRQILSPPEATKIDDLLHGIQASENFEQ